MGKPKPPSRMLRILVVLASIAAVACSIPTSTVGVDAVIPESNFDQRVDVDDYPNVPDDALKIHVNSAPADRSGISSLSISVTGRNRPAVDVTCEAEDDSCCVGGNSFHYPADRTEPKILSLNSQPNAPVKVRCSGGGAFPGIYIVKPA